MRTRSDGEIYTAIVAGASSRGMPAFADLAETARWQLVSFVRSLGGVRLRVRATDGGAGYPWDLPPGFPQPKVPADNPMSPAKVELGRHLFYDTRLSADGTFSCGTCHEQRLAFTDGKPRAVGHSGQIHPRSAMALANVAYLPVLTWANPTVRRLEAQALVPMFGDRPRGAGTHGHRARAAGPAGRRAALPGDVRGRFPRRADADQRRQRHQGHRLVRADAAVGPIAVRPGSAPAPTRAPMSPAALRGEDLFFAERTECFHCHGGFNFTESVDYVRPGAARHRVPQHRPLQPRRRRHLSGAQHRRPRRHRPARRHGPLPGAVAAQHRVDRSLHARRQHRARWPTWSATTKPAAARSAAARTAASAGPTCTRARS